MDELGGPFDAVVANMVLLGIRDWRGAVHNCVRALRSGGRFVFSLEHPCWAPDAVQSWAERGAVELREYVHEYERALPYGSNFHRPISAYLNGVTAFGCRIVGIAEPGLPAELVPDDAREIDVAVHIPNFIVVAADKS